MAAPRPISRLSRRICRAFRPVGRAWLLRGSTEPFLHLLPAGSAVFEMPVAVEAHGAAVGLIGRYAQMTKNRFETSTGRQRLGPCIAALPSSIPLLLALLLPLALVDQAGHAAEKANTCEVCHKDPDLLVTNKPLYDYYQEWSMSVHRQESVTCDDCHGGDPRTSGKDAAHGDGLGASDPSSGIHYAKVAETCGGCHQEILEGYRKSQHFEQVAAAKEQELGPTCVTCHGAINSDVLDFTSVGAACARCHNAERDNFPEYPAEAEKILNKFHSIHRFYRYIGIRAEPAEAKDFFEDLDARLQHLTVTWHTFDLEKIRAETAEVLTLLKAKRDEIRSRKAQEKTEAAAK
jgi:hypothetical protein